MRWLSFATLALVSSAGAGAGCGECGRAPSGEAPSSSAPSSSVAASASDASSPDASASASASALASALANAPKATSVVGGLGAPSAIVATASHVYFADAQTGSIGRVPREGGAVEVLAKNQAFPSSLTIIGDDVVWLAPSKTKEGPSDAGAMQKGVFACSTTKLPCTVRTIRNGSFVAMAVSGKDIFVAEPIEEKRFTLSRITGATVARIADHEGKPTALTADAANAYVTLFGFGNKAKVLVAPRAGDDKATKELGFRGPGFNAIGNDGEQLLATGIADRQFGFFRIAKETGTTSLIAHDVAPGAFAATGERIYFVSGKDLALHQAPHGKEDAGADEIVGVLPGITDPSAVSVADGWVYVAGKGPVDAGAGTGEIVRLPIR